MRFVIFCAALLLAQSSFAQQASLVISPAFIPPNTTVAGLPSCSASLTGYVYRVTDGLVPVLNAAVAGGGAVAVIVRCNGTSWLVGQ